MKQVNRQKSLKKQGMVEVRSLFANTEVCVDLKLFTRKNGRIPVGCGYTGLLNNDGASHFTFIEDFERESVPARRAPIVYHGEWINVHRGSDGFLYPTLHRPGRETFEQFCRYAAEELLEVSRLVENVDVA